PSGGSPVTVAQYKYETLITKFPGRTEEGVEIGGTEYENEVLAEEWDPRLPNLKEKYGYNGAAGTVLTELRPPGQEPWKFSYEGGLMSGTPAKLTKVERASAATTIAYNVPISGSGAPYNMSPETIAKWGQSDIPVDATAVFPPTHVPTEYPPHEYAGA